jgi:hypothetical protein
MNKELEKLEKILKQTLEKKIGSEKILQNDLIINNEAKMQNENRRKELQILKFKYEEKMTFLNLQQERLNDLEQQEQKIAASVNISLSFFH